MKINAIVLAPRFTQDFQETDCLAQAILTGINSLFFMSGELPIHPLLSAGWQTALPAVYEELRRLAAGYMRAERSDHTLQPTALVHEVVLRLHDQHSLDWDNRAEIFGVAAHMMRRILSNHATARDAAKRGGNAAHVTLDDALDFCAGQSVSLVALDDALRALEALDPVQGRVVELRFFGGLNIEEIAGLLGVSPATVKREWTVAKRWLQREIL